MAPLTNVAIPIELRDLIAAEHANGVSIERGAEAALRRQIAIARGAREQGERLTERYLIHPRLASTHGGPTIRVSQDLLADVADLAQTMSEEVERNVPKGRALQALLWADLVPIADEERRAVLRPATSGRLNVNVPRKLYEALLSFALRRKTRDIVVTVDDLLAQSLTTIAQNPDIVSVLHTKLDEHASPDPGVMTIRYGRTYEPAIIQVARSHFRGVKSRTIQALLWYGFDLKEDTPDELPDRQVLINGQLYAQIVQVAIEQRAERGRIVPVREFVEQAVTEKIDREKARSQKKQGSKKPGTT